MKNLLSLFLLTATWLSSCCNPAPSSQSAEHVILIGIDAMGARGVQRAATPHMNRMIADGAVTMKARCVLPSSSSPNWMSMVSGATPNMHGVTDNDWEPYSSIIVPSVKNKKGLFPTIFDHIKTQKPSDKVYLFYEWTEQDRMYDVSVADKAVTGLDGEQTMRQALEAFLKDKPELLFISVNEVDHVGHADGHESQAYMDCVHKYDALIGEFVKRIDEAGMTKNTVIIVTADHGGIGYSHGGADEAEIEIPIILYGGTVTKGKVIEHANTICDVAATAAGLLGVALPSECAGRFMAEAFEPQNDQIYIPMPFVQPFSGMYKEGVEVTMTADIEDGQIYYTTDGTVPTDRSTKYEAPILLKQSCVVRAVTYKNGRHGKTGEANLRVLSGNESPKVSYKYYENVKGKSLPDFTVLGTPVRQGYVHEFSLDELNVDEKDHFAVLFSAKFDILEAGIYTFGVVSDDGSKVYIDGKKVINNDGSHSSEMKRGVVSLAKGLHTVTVEYFDDYMGQKLELYYGSEKIPMQVLPFALFVK